MNVTTASDQNQAAVDVVPGGGFVVAWASNNQDGDHHGVYARWFSAAGAALTGEARVNVATAGEQEYPDVAVAPDGSAVISWSSQGQDGGGWGVYARQFTAAGQSVAGEFRVNTYTAGDQEFSSVGVDGSGNFVVTWSSNGQDGGGYGVYGQRFAAGGAKVGGEFRVNTWTADNQEYAQVAVDTAGNFTVVWASNNQDGAGWSARAQQYSAAGTPIGSEFRITTYISTSQQYPCVALDGLGHVVVAWYGNHGTDPSGVYFQRYDTSTQAETDGAVGDDFNPAGEDDLPGGASRGGGGEADAAGKSHAPLTPPSFGAPEGTHPPTGPIADTLSAPPAKSPPTAPELGHRPTTPSNGSAGTTAGWWAGPGLATESDDLDTLLGGVRIGRR